VEESKNELKAKFMVFGKRTFVVITSIFAHHDDSANTWTPETKGKGWQALDTPAALYFELATISALRLS